MNFDHLLDGDLPIDGESLMSSDHYRDDYHPREGGHPGYRRVYFDHLREGDHPRNGDHPRDGGRLRDFYHPKGWLLNFGSVESKVSTKNRH